MNEIPEIYKIGTRVRICKNKGFEMGLTGVIAEPPQNSFFLEIFGDNYFRKIQTRHGEEISVWVVFNKPQFDGDGDEPYSEAEINIKCLEVIE